MGGDEFIGTKSVDGRGLYCIEREGTGDLLMPLELFSFFFLSTPHILD